MLIIVIFSSVILAAHNMMWMSHEGKSNLQVKEPYLFSYKICFVPQITKNRKTKITALEHKCQTLTPEVSPMGPWGSKNEF